MVAGDVLLPAVVGGGATCPAQLPGRLPHQQQDALSPRGLASGRAAAVQATSRDSLPLCGHH
jgi:hypothetical protein